MSSTYSSQVGGVARNNQNEGLEWFTRLVQMDPTIMQSDFFNATTQQWLIPDIKQKVLSLLPSIFPTSSTSPSAFNTHSKLNGNHSSATTRVQNTTKKTHLFGIPSETHLISSSISSSSASPIIRTSRKALIPSIITSSMPSPSGSPSVKPSTTEEKNRKRNYQSLKNAVFPSPAKKKRKTKIKSKSKSISKRRISGGKKKYSNIGNVSKTHKSWRVIAWQKLQTLKRTQKQSHIFWEPVDEKKHLAPFYHLVCPLASDFGSICDKLDSDGYLDIDEFLGDSELVFINARMYNKPIHAIHEQSLQMEKKFKSLFDSFVKQYSVGNVNNVDETLKCWNATKNGYGPFAVQH